MTEHGMDAVVAEIIRRPNLTWDDQAGIMAELRQFPFAAADSIGRALRAGWKSEAHSKDIQEAFVWALANIYLVDERAVTRLLEDPSLAGSHMFVQWAVDTAREMRAN